MATPRHKSAGVAKVKPPKQFEGKVYRQDPAINEVAQFTHLGYAFGTHDECWQQAKTMTRHPILEMKEISHVAKH